MITTASAKQQNSFLLEGRGYILFLVFLLALAGLIIFGSRYNSSTHYTVASDAPLTITGAPGETVFITINAGTSVNGLWASTGGMSFAASSSPAVGIAAPKDQGWSDTIESDSDSSDNPIDISTSLVIPTPSNPSMTSITGQISGDVEYPSAYLAGYTNESTKVSIPVKIILLPASTVFVSEQLPLYVAAGAGILLLLVVPLLCRLYDAQRRRNNPVLW